MSLPEQPPQTRLKFAANIIYITVGLVASIITITTLLTASSIGALIVWLTNQEKFKTPLLYFALGVGASLFAVILIVSLIYLFNRFIVKSYPIRWLLYGYRWISADFVYCIEDDALTQHSQIITTRIKTTRPGVNIFENKYKSSIYTQQDRLEVLSPGHELMGSITRRQFYFPYRRWKYYYIYLGHELPLGEEVEVKIRQDLSDPDHTFEPFLAKTITEPMKSLKMSVLLPQNCALTSAINYELNHEGPNSKVINKDDSRREIEIRNGRPFRKLTYEVQNPHFNHRYEIQWRW